MELRDSRDCEVDENKSVDLVNVVERPPYHAMLVLIGGYNVLNDVLIREAMLGYFAPVFV